MTSQRAQAYGRVLETLADIGPSKLLPAEQDRIREAADVLLFAEGNDGQTVDSARADVLELIEHLVASDRWTEERARKLVDDIGACGPGVPVG